LIELEIPIAEEAITSLRVGDSVSLSGIIVTARDAAHKYMIENFIDREPPESERALYDELSRVLKGGVLYHCGPIVKKEGDLWRFIAAGPTTSIREEVYEDRVIEKFGVRGIIGKGGMGPRTLKACREFKAVYFHAIGGAASLIAKSVKEVEAVYKLREFGTPEAFWKIRVERFPVVVTMDSHGRSIHEEVETESRRVLEGLMG
jgi:fumarate hydratase class I